jgi:hypothetical protein
MLHSVLSARVMLHIKEVAAADNNLDGSKILPLPVFTELGRLGSLDISGGWELRPTSISMTPVSQRGNE